MKKNCTITAFGKNSNGQCEISDSIQKKVVMASAGYFHTLVLTTKKHVYA